MMFMNEEERHSPLTELIVSLRRYVELNTDYARLTAAEKLSLMMSKIAFLAVIAVIATFVLVFVSLGVGYFLAQYLSPGAAFLYVSGFYVLVLVIVLCLRRRLFTDPVTRYITGLIVKPPRNPQNK